MSAREFFGDEAEDDDLEARNGIFWTSMLEHIALDRGGRPPRSILDIGAHRGGLLAAMASRWHPTSLWAIEPNERSRQRAVFRLRTLAAQVQVVAPSAWPTVPSGAVDLVTCHEVLHAIEDLEPLLVATRRVLDPVGAAYVVLGCHTENPIWPRWKSRLETSGVACFDHAPMEILRLASAVGFHTSVRPLLPPGWVHHDPLLDSFGYPTVTTLLDHHHRHKLLFRLGPR